MSRYKNSSPAKKIEICPIVYFVNVSFHVFVDNDYITLALMVINSFIDLGGKHA